MRRREARFGKLDTYIPPLLLEEEYEAHSLPVLDWKYSQGAVVG